MLLQWARFHSCETCHGFGATFCSLRPWFDLDNRPQRHIRCEICSGLSGLLNTQNITSDVDH